MKPNWAEGFYPHTASMMPQPDSAAITSPAQIMMEEKKKKAHS